MLKKWGGGALIRGRALNRKNMVFGKMRDGWADVRTDQWMDRPSNRETNLKKIMMALLWSRITLDAPPPLPLSSSPPCYPLPHVTPYPSPFHLLSLSITEGENARILKNRAVNGWTDGRTDGRTDGQMNGWTNSRTDQWTDGWTIRWTNGRTDPHIQKCGRI